MLALVGLQSNFFGFGVQKYQRRKSYK